MDQRESGLTLWPERILGPRPGLKELNVICWSVFICFLVVPICVILFIQYRTDRLFFLHSPVDFIYFYGTGQIANAHSPVDVYDYTLQKQTFNKIQPLQEGMYSPSPYPPLVSQFFRLFARLPFAEAYFIWMGVSIVLYITGIALTLKSFLPDQKLENSLLFCFALAFSAFLMNTLADGQLSAVAVCFVGVALALEKRSRFLISGLALSVLTYKFTFLFLLVPMLLLTRRFRSFAGFAIGTGILVAVTTAFFGPEIWPAYAHLVNGFGHTSGLYGQTSARLWKYVDFNSFSYAVLGRRTPIEFALLVCVVVSALTWLGILLWRSKRDSRPEASLAWASTLTWTMLLNIYYPIYDSILVVIALILTFAALKELKWPDARRQVVLLASLVFLVSWFTEPIAKRFGVQLLTLALLALAIAQSVFLNRAIRLRTAPRKEEALAAG